jgi:hypothetical protein
MVWKTVTALSLLTTVIGAALAATAYLTGDGRRCKRPIVNRFSRRTSQFLEIDADDAYDNGWFKRELRCSKATFNIIVQKIRLKWNDVNSPLHIRTIFTIRERVALALYHLASSGTYSRSGLMFDILAGSLSEHSRWRSTSSNLSVAFSCNTMQQNKWSLVHLVLGTTEYIIYFPDEPVFLKIFQFIE